MRFGYTILYVNDVEATLAFYESAFGLRRGMLDDGKNYGELDTGHTRLAFAARGFVRQLLPLDLAECGPKTSAPPVELGMIADDVQSAFDRAMGCGAVEVKRPEKKPWGQTVGYVRELNGFLIEICSPME